MKLRHVLGIGLLGTLGAGAFLGGCTVFGIRAGYEEAGHSVLREDGSFEIRQYDDAIVARTTTTGDYDQAGSQAFRRLGGYIFGKNRSQESVAMTTPVIQEEVAPQRAGDEGESETIAMTTPVFQEETGGRWVQTFVLPSEHTMETLPIPTDPNVVIMKLPGAKVAVVRYSGLISSESIAEHTRLLEQWIEEQGLTATSAPRSAGYDPPWTIPFLRRNEVHIEIE